MSNRRSLILVSIALNVLLLLFCLYVGFKYKQASQYPEKSDALRYNIKTSDFKLLDQKEKNKIVFIGDSLTEFNQWNESFNKSGIVNRGIGGDTTQGVINRLNSTLSSSPQKLFLMIGINDLLQGKSTDSIITNYNQLVNQIKQKSPDTKVYIESILPINNAITGSKVQNSTITSLNNKLKNIADKNDYQFINLYGLFNQKGQLKQNLTIDGVHLNAEGYSVWINAVKGYVDGQ